MNEKKVMRALKKESFLQIRYICLVLFIAGVLLVIWIGKDAYLTMRGPKKLTDIPENRYSKEYVLAEVYSISNNSFASNRQQYYLVDVGMEKDILFMTKTPDIITQIPGIIYETTELFYNGETKGEPKLVVEGGIRELKTSEKESFDRFIESKIDTEHLQKEIIPYVLVETDIPYGDIGGLAVELFLGIGFILFGIVCMIYLIAGGFQKSMFHHSIDPNKKQNKKKILELYDQSVKFRGIAVGDEYIFFYHKGHTKMVKIEEIKSIFTDESRKQKKTTKESTLHDIKISLQSENNTDKNKVYRLKAETYEFISYINLNRKDLKEKMEGKKYC